MPPTNQTTVTNPPRLISNAEAARRLGVSAASLTVMRCRGSITIPYFKLRRKVWYDPVDVQSYVDERRVDPVSA